MVSRLELRRRRDVPAFLADALALRRRFRHAPGGGALWLAAEPWSGRFWTCSTWRDDTAMAAFVRDGRHVETMRRHAGRLRSSSFATAAAPGPDGPDWSEVVDLLATAARPGMEELAR